MPVTERIASAVTKIVLYPFIFFVIYGLIIVLAERIVLRLVEINYCNIGLIVIIAIISSALAFVFTVIFHSITKYWSKSFRKWFDYSHLLLGYIFGLLSVMIIMEPLLLKEGIIEQIGDVTNDEAVVSTFVLFLVVSNYSLYKTIILEDKFDINKRWQHIHVPFKNSIRGKWVGKRYDGDIKKDQ